tara:strand:- start:734 stop:1480 length:747 start_codon:yes stop_codon:yes gene_type:complete
MGLLNKSILIYGPDSCNKYDYALNLFRSYSPSQLKYKRKVEISVNDTKYYFILSDVHIEVDFELLGNNEQAIWYALYQQIDIICKERINQCIVLCLNIHKMKDELLELFYVFFRKPHIQFILCTKNISHLPNSLKEKCIIKCLKHNNKIEIIETYKPLCDPIINIIFTHNVDYLLIRDCLYNLLIHNLDIHECFYYIIQKLLNKDYIKCEEIHNIMDKIGEIMKMFNNNYRTIYHLEHFVIYLMLLKR